MRLPILVRIVLVAIAAILFAFCWIYESWFGIGWVALPLFFASLPNDSPRASIWLSLLFAWVGLSVAFQWAPISLAYTLNCEEHDLLPYGVFLGLLLWESVPFGLFGWMISRIESHGWPVWGPVCGWITIESFWPKVFPWAIAHSQTAFLPFLQLAEIGGTHLLSFVMLYACMSLGFIVARRTPFTFAQSVPIGLAVLALGFGWIRIQQFEALPASPSIAIGVVQVDPSYVDSVQKMRALSDAFPKPVDLILWPESTIGTYSTSVTSLQEMEANIDVARMPFIAKEHAEGLQRWLLVGGRTFDPGAPESGPYYQTAFLVDPQGKITDRYLKRHLIPVGEYVPFEKSFPQLHDWAQLSDYIEVGTSDEPVRMRHPDGRSHDVRIGTLICYEDVVPNAARKTSLAGAQLLVCLINASAFEHPASLAQHRRLAHLRAVENRRYMVRCSGTGVSCAISPTGKMITQLPVGSEGSFVVAVPLLGNITFYSLAGYLFPYLCLVLCMFVSWTHRKPDSALSTSIEQPQ